MSEPMPLAGAVSGLRMLADGTIAVTLHFEPKDRTEVMAMMGAPGVPVACVRLRDGHAAVGAKQERSTYADLGPICREAIDLCANEGFQRYVVNSYRGTVAASAEAAKAFILTQCDVSSRKQLDTAEGARDLFIAHVRKPFFRWLDQQPK